MEAEQNFGPDGSQRAQGETMEGIAEDVKLTLREAAAPLKEKAEELVHEQTKAGFDHVDAVTRAIHRAAGELESDMPNVASYVHDAGSQLERKTDRFRSVGLDDLVRDFKRLSCEQPALMFGGAILAGIALSRFLKSSAPETRAGNGSMP